MSATPPLTLKLKLSTRATLPSAAANTGASAPTTGAASSSSSSSAAAAMTATAPPLIGARGGAALKELLSTAPEPEAAIRGFQAAHGLTAPSLAPAVQLLDLLAVSRADVAASLLNALKRELLLRVAALPPSELQRALDATFPFLEFRELRAVPLAILARQEHTPPAFLRELTANRRILAELPVHVRRKILHVDPHELRVFVDECVREYVQHMAQWYLTSSTAPAAAALARHDEHLAPAEKRSDAAADLWNVASHVPPSLASAASTAAGARPSRWGLSPEERRRSSPALAKLTEMLGDSEALYLATVEILKDYVVAASIPGSSSSSSASAKEYVDYVPFLGALRADLANLQRDRTTALLRTDPLHKFLWFLDRAVKQQALETSQLHELLGFIGKLRTGDLPPNKKFKRKSGSSSGGAGAGAGGGAGGGGASGGAAGLAGDDEEEHFEVVHGPPPVDELVAVLDKIAKADARLIFAEPVPDDVPTYRDVIKEPMDLSTMRRKAKRGKYKSVEMFADDFQLMIRNCLTFNPDTTVFYKEGRRVGKRGGELIEKHMQALRGEPQRIRAKKRRKVAAAAVGGGPSEAAVSMLTSSGVAALRDFGDVDQSGMVPEGVCDELLADAAMVLADPQVKQLLCDALLKHLVAGCWPRRELPTDSLVCRGVVQLLQLGNAASVRRMIRKRDFVLRAPQVVTMRVVLPLLLRAMAAHRVGVAALPPAAALLLPPRLDAKAKDELLDAALWENVLRASSAIRALTKALVVQSLVDHQPEFSAQLLQFVLAAEDELLLRDRAFLHAVSEAALEQVKASLSSSSSSSSDHHSADAAAPSERVKALGVWKFVVRDFFVSVLEQRIRVAKASAGGVVVRFSEAEAPADSGRDADSGDSDEPPREAVKSFPVPVFQEVVAVLLVSVLALIEKASGSAAAASEDVAAPCVRRSLGVLRSCCASQREFELLWGSRAFRACRALYEQLLARCPALRVELFHASDEPQPKDASGAEQAEAGATGYR
ncbi:hypothetical protein PybrP1_007456 [[Pythium] brassicae (nom. inval.)]|nr:hypothetical protein PybrP1_007456 [[Pythium] brassicae (nom. inval.)]